MKQKFITKDGKEVSIGDTLVNKSVMNTVLGEGTITVKVRINEDTLPTLLKEGILIPLSDAHGPKCTCEQCLKNKVPTYVTYYMQKLADKFGIDFKEVNILLGSIDKVYPAASFSMIMREIAIEMDKKYEDHIENSPEIYVVSAVNGTIVKANKAHIKNYRNFAAFRTLEDARTACRIMRPVLKVMFADRGRK